MLSLFILCVIIIFKAEAQDLDNDPVEITFKIHAEVSAEGAVKIICDHTADFGQNQYRVFEGKEFQIYTKYNSYINHVTCHDVRDNEISPCMVKLGSKDKIIFKAERAMNGFWNCTVLLHHDHSPTLPKVQYKDVNYTATHCYMWIHVRPIKSLQTILVNNMELQTVRTDLSDEDIDFTAEYHYADGDVVNVTCFSSWIHHSDGLKMQLSMEGTVADKPTYDYGITYKVVGFMANLHSGHNNSYMLCLRTEYYDVRTTTTVMVRFIMKTQFNLITVRINGMAVRPLKIAENYYDINYKYESLHPMNVVYEVHQKDLELAVTDDAFHLVNSYSKTELIPRKKAEMSFYFNGTDYNAFSSCVASNYISGAIAERVMIFFTAGTYPKKQYSLHITSSNGTAMDSYINDREIKYIYYDYNDGEILELKCGPLLITPDADRNSHRLSLLFRDTEERSCNTVGCTLSKSLILSRRDNDSVIVCAIEARYYYLDHKPISQIRLLLRERVLTTTSTTTSTTTTPVTTLNTTRTAADPASSAPSTSNTLIYCGSAAGVAVIAILIVGGYWTVKKRYCCARMQCVECSVLNVQELRSMPTPKPDPASVYYQNLRLSIFKPNNERGTAEIENIYEEFE